MERICIIGLGLIGGSIGLALKAAGLKDIEIAGTARTRETLRAAKRLGAIDREEPGAAEAAKGARLVVIAAPILATKQIMEEIAPVLAEGVVVTDAGSTKANVMGWARETLPAHAHFIGGHPMAGKETTGVEAADAGLFRDKTWVVVPSVEAPEPAVQTVLGLVRACGAQPTFMDAAEHDSYVAAISHLPLALATALFSVAFGSQAWPELAGLASSGFRDTTRLASGSPVMAHDIAVTNREHLLHWIDRFGDELARLREAIASSDSAAITQAFETARAGRDSYLASGPPSRRVAAPPVEGVSVTDMLLGSKIGGMLRKQQEILRDAEAREGKR